jgi:hypothetical protein
MSSSWNLDAPLLALSPQGDVTTIRQSFEHYSCMGATGGGKSSAMATLSAAMLRAGYGFLVLTTKYEETEYWIRHCRANGRGDSVVIFDESQGYNFIDHELYRQGAAGLGNVTECIMRIVDAAESASGSAVGRPSDEFWKAGIRQWVSHTLPLLYSAWGKVTVASIIEFITSAATDGKQYTDRAFNARSFAGRTMARTVDRPAVPLPPDVLRPLLDYWVNQYPAIPDKTRGNLLISLTTKLDRFTSGRMKNCFCDRTTIVPEMMFQGAVIIMNMPVLTWNEDGIIGQRVFKYMAQRTTEARNTLAPALKDRPLCFWFDEAQNHVDRDEEFLSTARSSRASVVLMSQSLPTYFARQAPEKAAAVKSLIGKCNTHIWMLNSCPETNQWASSLIGRGIQYRSTQSGNTGRGWSRNMNEGANSGSSRGTSTNHGSNWSAQGGGGSHGGGSSDSTNTGESLGASVGDSRNEGEGWSVAEQMDALIEPNFFATSLRTGGPANGNLVDSIWYRAGANFRGGMLPHVLKVTFRQGKP